MTLTQLFTNIANAIRSKKGTSGTIIAENFPQEILSIDYNVKTVPNNETVVNVKTRIAAWITEISNLNIGNLTDINNMFNGCSSLISVPLFDTSNVANMNYMFSNCSSLVSVPLFDTSNVTSMNNMFNGCTSLTTIPLFDTSSVKTMASIFTRVTALTDQSLDNILQMCINATSYTDTSKTLSRLGLGNVPNITTRVPQLPHYQEFIDAGWSIS